MSDSTTQPTKTNTSVIANQSAFEKELLKKIRNKTKKIETIKVLEAKIKKEGIKPNEEQLNKIASKAVTQAEIDEVKGYLDLYQQSAKETETNQKNQAKQHAKELTQARKSAVTTVANMITLHTLLDCGQTVPEEVAEGVNHFRENINKLTLRNEPGANWRQSRDAFISEWTKLVSGSHETIQLTDSTYEDLSTGIFESISSGGYPEEISKPKKEKKQRPKKEPRNSSESKPEPE